MEEGKVGGGEVVLTRVVQALQLGGVGFETHRVNTESGVLMLCQSLTRAADSI